MRSNHTTIRPFTKRIFLEAVRALLAAGVDESVANNDGQLPVELAAANNKNFV